MSNKTIIDTVEPVVDAPVVPAEPTEAEKQLAAFKVRQELVKTAIKGLVSTLFADPAEFTVDELGWASDAFKQWLQICTTATTQHEAFAKTNQDAQEAFYSLKVKDLTSTYAEKLPEAPAAPTDVAPV